MGPSLIVVLADLEYDSASILNRMAAAFPARRTSWNGDLLTLARTGFGRAVTFEPGPSARTGHGLVYSYIDIAHIDFGPEPSDHDNRIWEREWARYTEASIDLADRVRPMLLTLVVEFPVDNLFDAGPSEASYLFGSGWACPDRMDGRRADGFRRALDGVDHRVTAAGVAWAGVPAATAEQLRLAWVRRPPDTPTRRHG